MKVIVASLAGAMCVAASSARAEIIHARDLGWNWPSSGPSTVRQIAGESIRQSHSRRARSNQSILDGDPNVSFGPFDLAPGFQVGPQHEVWLHWATMLLDHPQAANPMGLFVGYGEGGWFVHPSGYLGFRVATAQPDSFLYGWMRIESTSPNPFFAQFTITEYAYQSAPDTPILAGAIPAPGALALLGLSGLVASRRRR